MDLSVQRAEQLFRQSMTGVRQELMRKDLSPVRRQQLQVELMQQTKRNHQQLIRDLTVEEMESELEREVAMRMETSAIARQRLQRRHDHDRAVCKARIERIRAECELSLTSAMAQQNLLR